MERLIIYGIDGPAARVAIEAERSGLFEIAAFVKEGATPDETFFGRPVMDAQSAKAAFPPKSAKAFASCDARFLNQDRLSLYLAAKQAGYAIVSVVSPSAVVAPGVRMRENVFVDAGARVLDGVNIGANVWLLANAIVNSRAKLGSSCWLDEGSSVGSETNLGKNCTLARHASIASRVSLPAWSLINRDVTVTVSPSATIFIDPLFPNEVVLRGSNPKS